MAIYRVNVASVCEKAHSASAFLTPRLAQSANQANLDSVREAFAEKCVQCGGRITATFSLRVEEIKEIDSQSPQQPNIAIVQ